MLHSLILNSTDVERLLSSRRCITIPTCLLIDHYVGVRGEAEVVSVAM